EQELRRPLPVFSALFARVVGVVRVAHPASARYIRLRTIGRLAGLGAAAFRRVGQVRPLMAAAGPTVMAVGLFDLIGSRHDGSPVLLQALIGGVLLAVALLALLIVVAIALAARGTGLV